jgi:cation:H+ antiporter
MLDFIPDHIYLFVFGLILLIKGGDWFVDGAQNIAKKFKVPELLIGATVVSIGTTLPEVMTSATSALTGHGEIAYGNAIGSIICNTALIAAITIAIKPGKTDRKTLLFPTCFFFGAAIFYSIVAYAGGKFTRPVGIVLLCAFVAYMVINVINMKKKPESSLENSEPLKEEETSVEEISMLKSIFWLVVGALAIAVGADLLVDSSTIIAKDLGMSEAVIGLTVVALGTSLPELVTAITALSKGHGALSLGNVIGANIFNLVLVSGVAVTLSPFTVPLTSELFGQNVSFVLDIPVMLSVMAILTIPAIIKNKLSRWQGITLLSIYVLFLVAQFVFVKPIIA